MQLRRAKIIQISHTQMVVNVNFLNVKKMLQPFQKCLANYTKELQYDIIIHEYKVF